MSSLATILEQIASGDEAVLRNISNEFRQKVERQAQVVRDQSPQPAPPSVSSPGVNSANKP